MAQSKFIYGRMLLLMLAVLLAACSNQRSPEGEAGGLSTAVSPNPIATESTAQSTETITVIPTVPPAATNRRVEVEDGIQFPQLLPFDGIRPVYAPEFETAENVSLQGGELIIGISLGGEAKAYPITVLQFREMVDDDLAGIPILVTW